MCNLELFAQRVRDTRKELNASVDDVALFSQLSPDRIKVIESGADKSVDALEIKRLAFALGVTYEYLLFGKAVI